MRKFVSFTKVLLCSSVTVTFTSQYLYAQCELGRNDFPLAGVVGVFHEGEPIALSQDASTIAIGADSDDDRASNAGAVFILIRSGDSWIEQAKLFAPDANANDQFGRTVALSADGNTLLVGAWLDDDQGTNSGSAYVFFRQSGFWNLESKILPLAGEKDSHFGIALSLSAFGDRALIGSPLRDNPQTDAGAAFLFERQGGQWNQVLRYGDPALEADDQFGIAVELSDDGKTALIGTPRDDDINFNSGAAYVFTEEIGGWARQQKLLPDAGSGSGSFGFQLSLSGDGETCAIGAPLEFGPDTTGAVYVFRRNGSNWNQETILQQQSSTVESPFGFAMDLVQDGNRLVVGQTFTFAFTSPGSALIYERQGGAWSLQSTLHPSDPHTITNYAERVYLSADHQTAIVLGEESILKRVIYTYSLNQDCPQFILLNLQPSFAGLENSLAALWPMEGDQVVFAWSRQLGSTPAPGCPGLVSDLSQPIQIATSAVNEFGGAVVQAQVPSSARGLTLHFQALLPAHCQLSNVVQAFLR